MGRQIVCPECNTVFDETLLKLKYSENICLVCGASLSGEPIDYENFFPGVELGEFDSFDEDKIDMWWYDIRQPKTLEETDTGNIFTICTKCGRLTVFSYPVAIKDNYVLINQNTKDKCYECGNPVKNHIFMKRPPYIPDPKLRPSTITTPDNIPKCPICSSTNIHKIGLVNKTFSALTFGVLAAGHLSKTFQCDNCGAKF